MSDFTVESLPGRLYAFYVSRVPDHPSKVRIERWLSHVVPNELRIRHKTGASFYMPAWDCITHSCLKDKHDRESLALACRLLEKGGLFVDCGACFGLYTCIVALIPKVTAVAIEPYPESFTLLSKNVTLNGLDNVSLCSVAASDRYGVIGLSAPVQGNIGTTQIRKDAKPSLYTTGIAIQDLLQELGCPPIRLLKIDVEGHEPSVLRGMVFTGPFRPENVLIEVEPAFGESAGTAIEILRLAGYDAYTVGGQPLRKGMHIPENNLWMRSTA
jgi:FkbM family methyltransferase